MPVGASRAEMMNVLTKVRQRSILRDVSYFAQRWLMRRPFLTAELSSSGPVFKVKTEDVVGRHIYKYHAHELDICNWLIGNLDPQEGDVLIDIGANVGWYSILFDSLAKPNSVVLAFEPDPLNCELLRTNVDLNNAQGVHVVEAAVAESPGKAALYLYNSNNLGRHSMLKTEGSDSIDVETISLDDWLAEKGLGDRVVRVIKIDIEGYEYFALKSGIQTLRQCSLVISEYDPKMIRSFGLEPEEPLDLLEQAGMKPGLLSKGNVEPVTREGLLSSEHGLNVVWQRG